VEQGDEITPHYDPMIAKLIVWGADRAQALSRMRQALAQFRVVGVQNNVAFLARLVALPAFAQGRFDTGLIEPEQDALFPPGREVPEAVWLIAALSELLREQRLALQAAERSAEAASPWAALK
jgi:3-methylcrotonyl-CoA carboxylase alpha subunit